MISAKLPFFGGGLGAVWTAAAAGVLTLDGFVSFDSFPLVCFRGLESESGGEVEFDKVSCFFRAFPVLERVSSSALRFGAPPPTPLVVAGLLRLGLLAVTRLEVGLLAVGLLDVVVLDVGLRELGVLEVALEEVGPYEVDLFNVGLSGTSLLEAGLSRDALVGATFVAWWGRGVAEAAGASPVMPAMTEPMNC